VCIGFALLDAWSGRQLIDGGDGVSYLDMSDALLKHNWHLLINPYWSPVYPFLIGMATWLTHPSAYWEVPIVHVVNFAIFLGALASFEFLLRQVICVLRRENCRQDADSTAPLPAWIWQLLGYSLFAWSTFVLIGGLRRVTPDLCVATFVYLDAGLLLRLRTGAKRSRTCLLLGLTLGFGYLAKTILFPMAFVFMAVAFFVVGKWRKALLPLALTLLLFSAVAAPLFVSISRMVGSPSFGESGSLNYAWLIDGKSPFPFYTSGPPPYLKHPMNLLHKRPNVFGFEEPEASTYTLWDNPQYWNAGVSKTFSPRGQLRVIGQNLSAFCTDLHMMPMWGLIAGGFIFSIMRPNVPRRFQHILRSWPLFVPGVAGISVYALVSLQPRYIGSFVVLVLLGLFPEILLQKSQDTVKRTSIATLVFAGFMMVFIALNVVYHLAGFPILRGGGDVHYRAAESLNKEGARPGDAVALIGFPYDAVIWARLARVRIVAQVPPEDASDLWRASDPRVKAEVYDAFARAGAMAVVAEEAPPSEGFADWQRVGGTRYYVHFLSSPKDK
jgi:hypothetical protein